MALFDYFRRRDPAVPQGATGAAPEQSATPSERERALQLLHEVIDPEAGIDVVDMGLVLRVAVDAERVDVDLAMTSPACPMGEMMSDNAREVLRREWPGRKIHVRLDRDYRWTPAAMSPAARARLGW
jgi:metal-sulfur cluster biosynthetic enzyme